MIGQLVTLGALRSPDRVALKMRNGPSLTYRELESRTNRLANSLIGSGLRPGDRVAAWMEDTLDYPVLYLALAKAGLVVVPINAKYLAAEAAYCLSDSGARALVWSDGLTELVQELEDVPREMLLVSEDGSGPAGTRSLRDLETPGVDAPPPPPNPDALLVLAYTSGTTGSPKGAMLTHRSVLAICRINTIAYRLPHYSVAAITGTLSFPAMMPAHVLSHLYVGGTSIIMGRWDPESLIDTIERESVTFTYLATPVMHEFAQYARTVPERWSTLQSVLHSSSRATPEQRMELCDVIGWRYVEGWGMTENSGGLMTATTAADISSPPPGLDIHRSAGRAVVETVIEVVDPDGAPVPHDGETLGELVYRGPALMDGYWNRPDASALALKDGWLHSGDLGMIDEQGYVHLTERRTDLIVSGGMNVYPSEVERCIMALPEIAECVVVGVPHERWGQTVVAVIVGAHGGVTEKDVIEHCKRQLASYKKPTRVLFMPEVPRTASLKVKRADLRELVSQVSAKSAR